MDRRWLVLSCVSVAVAAAPVAGQGRAFTPQDWYRLTTLSGPAVSPDGRWVAFTTTTVKEAENKRHSEIWMVATTGGDPIRLTSPSLESSGPRWSPDGKLLLFSSSRPGSKARTWALRMDRPAGEAFEVDSLPEGSVTSDGQTLVYTDTTAWKRDSTQKDPYEKMAPMARPPFQAITKPLDPARFDGRHITDLGYKFNGRGFIPGPREARRWNPAQIWTRPVAGGPKRQLTNAVYSHREVAVSPDGRWIAFVADAQLRPDSVAQAERDSLQRAKYDPKLSEAPRNDADIFVIPATGGEPRRLTTASGAEGNLEWSPDGTRLAYVSQLNRTTSQRIFVVPAAGGAPVVTCQRVVRAQPVPKRPGHAHHFKLLALATAGRETEGHGFVVAALLEQIRALIAGLDALARDGHPVTQRTLRLLATPARVALADRIADALAGEIEVVRAPLEHAYYDGLRFMLDLVAPDGAVFPIADGGAFDWVARLTSNRRLVYVASGLGTQLLALVFAPRPR